MQINNNWKPRDYQTNPASEQSKDTNVTALAETVSNLLLIPICLQWAEAFNVKSCLELLEVFYHRERPGRYDRCIAKTTFIKLLICMQPHLPVVQQTGRIEPRSRNWRDIWRTTRFRNDWTTSEVNSKAEAGWLNIVLGTTGRKTCTYNDGIGLLQNAISQHRFIQISDESRARRRPTGNWPSIISV